MCVLAIAGVLAVLSAGAFANVVTISPDNPGDWSWLLVQGGSSTARMLFLDGGPAPAEGNPFPTANGGFFASLTYNGESSGSPDHVWLGVDKHNGQPLAGIPLGKITKLQYDAYNSGVYNEGFTSNSNPRRFPRQPFQVTITAVCESTGDRRHFIYRPWGLGGWQHWNLRREWITNDAIAMTSTPNFGREMPAPVWFEPWTGATFTSWGEILATDPGGGRPWYGDWTLVPTSTYYDPTRTDPLGWMNADYTDPRTTGTGKPINLQVGARGNGSPPYGGIYEGANFQGYVDSFTLGIDYGTELEPNIVETTYDFASSDPYVPKAREVAISNIGSCWSANPPYNYPYAKFSAPTVGNQRDFVRRYFGQVLDMTSVSTGWETQLGPNKDPDTGEFYFTIWDGSYAPVSDALIPWYAGYGLVNVRLPYQECTDIVMDEPWTFPVAPGDFVSVTGYQYSRFYFKISPPLEISCSRENVVKAYAAPQ